VLVATKVFILTMFPKRQQRPGDKTYLCYEDTIPQWDKDLFYVQGQNSRSWFCHESSMEISQSSLRGLAEQVKEDYSPQTEEALRRRLHNPLIAQIVVCRAENLAELQELLDTVNLQLPL